MSDKIPVKSHDNQESSLISYKLNKIYEYWQANLDRHLGDV